MNIGRPRAVQDDAEDHKTSPSGDWLCVVGIGVRSYLLSGAWPRAMLTSHSLRDLSWTKKDCQHSTVAICHRGVSSAPQTRRPSRSHSIGSADLVGRAYRNMQSYDLTVCKVRTFHGSAVRSLFWGIPMCRYSVQGLPCVLPGQIGVSSPSFHLAQTIQSKSDLPTFPDGAPEAMRWAGSSPRYRNADWFCYSERTVPS